MVAWLINSGSLLTMLLVNYSMASQSNLLSVAVCFLSDCLLLCWWFTSPPRGIVMVHRVFCIRLAGMAIVGHLLLMRC